MTSDLLSGHGTVLAVAGCVAVQVAIRFSAEYLYDRFMGPVVCFLLFLLAVARTLIYRPVDGDVNDDSDAVTVLTEARRSSAADATHPLTE